jgi:hypothetical protein
MITELVHHCDVVLIKDGVSSQEDSKAVVRRWGNGKPREAIIEAARVVNCVSQH